VTLKSEHVWEADSWGEGFAPFFIPLALWVGALITWLLLRPMQTRALMTSVNGFRMAWGSLNPALLLSLGQVTIMLTVMHFAIGLNPKNMIATFCFTMLAAAAFFALQQLFQVTLGSAVGKVVIIALLMVQLASAGGTYPIQTTPSFLQAISPYLPMTYVVAGLRESITGGIEARFWFSVVVMAAIFIVSLAATSIASARKRVWTMSRLHPALSI
jgi:putative membrane protein